MSQPLTLESLPERVGALEQALKLRSLAPKEKNWQNVVGMFGDSEFMRQVDEEGRKIREAERKQARDENPRE